MKQLINVAKEQNQLLRPNMENIAEMPMSEKMSILSSLTTLTIDIQKALQSWTDFQHHLAITAPAIVDKAGTIGHSGFGGPEVNKGRTEAYH